MDAALVEIAADRGWPVPESLSDLTARPPQRYRLLIGTCSHTVPLTGFPGLRDDPVRGRLGGHLEGQITPGLPGSDGTRWSGMSGAVVLTGGGSVEDLLCGVVCEDRQADDGTRLTATPISHLLTDQQGKPSEFRRLVAGHTGWDPVLEAIEPAHLFERATVYRDLASPAAALPRADIAAVVFHGRDLEVAALKAWCTTGLATFVIQVITGPGGQGKTRLARHLTDILSREGWPPITPSPLRRRMAHRHPQRHSARTPPPGSGPRHPAPACP
ncbi:hypothetical protein ACWC98_30350 [Streptomyces goshikiensis]